MNDERNIVTIKPREKPRKTIFPKSQNKKNAERKKWHKVGLRQMSVGGLCQEYLSFLECDFKAVE